MMGLTQRASIPWLGNQMRIGPSTWGVIGLSVGLFWVMGAFGWFEGPPGGTHTALSMLALATCPPLILGGLLAPSVNAVLYWALADAWYRGRSQRTGKEQRCCRTMRCT